MPPDRGIYLDPVNTSLLYGISHLRPNPLRTAMTVTDNVYPSRMRDGHLQQALSLQYKLITHGKVTIRIGDHEGEPFGVPKMLHGDIGPPVREGLEESVHIITRLTAERAIEQYMGSDKP